MFFGSLRDSDGWSELTLSEKGVLLDALIACSGREQGLYFPDAAAAPLMESLVVQGFMEQQMSELTFDVGYVPVLIKEYKQYCNSQVEVRPLDGDADAVSPVSRRVLNTNFEGYFPTNRYDATGEVYYLGDERKSELERLHGGRVEFNDLQKYYDLLMSSPSYRPAARKLMFSLVRYLRVEDGWTKDRSERATSTKLKSLIDALES